MKTYVSLFLLLTSVLTIEDTAGNYATQKVEITSAQKLRYVRQLSKFFFRKFAWKQHFDESKCPEFTDIVTEVENKCMNPNQPPIQPLPPVTVCQANPNFPDCSAVEEPNCQDNLRLCQPPTVCDLPDNQYLSELNCNDKEVDCAANPGHNKCKYASKCDVDPEYKDHPSCQAVDPCREDSSMCLTICDRAENKEKFRCLLEKCERFPNLPECAKCKYCKIDRTCEGINIFTDPRCCPDMLCNPKCKEEEEYCDPVDPPTKCKWGYALGKEIQELFIEPIQKHVLEQDEILSFYKCYTEYIKEHQTIELQCFEDGMADGYEELTMALEKKLEQIQQNYDNVETLVDEKNYKKIKGTNDFRKVEQVENIKPIAAINP